VDRRWLTAADRPSCVSLLPPAWPSAKLTADSLTCGPPEIVFYRTVAKVRSSPGSSGRHLVRGGTACALKGPDPNGAYRVPPAPCASESNWRCTPAVRALGVRADLSCRHPGLANWRIWLAMAPSGGAITRMPSTSSICVAVEPWVWELLSPNRRAQPLTSADW